MNKITNNIYLKEIRYKTIVTIIGLFVLTITSIFLLLQHCKKNFVLDHMKIHSEQIVTTLHSAIRISSDKNELQKLLNLLATNESINYIYIFDKKDETYLEISNVAIDKTNVHQLIQSLKINNQEQTSYVKSKVHREKDFILSTSFFQSDKFPPLRILISLNGKHFNSEVKMIIRHFGALLLILFLLVIVIAFFLIKIYIISPIEKFTELENNRLLTKLNDQLKRESATKQIFLSHMSHEIRTPLNAILGIGELLVETPLNEKQSKLLSLMNNSGKTLLGIVNDILDFSAIEAQKMTIEHRSFCLKTLVTEVVEVFQNISLQKNVKLSYKFEENLPLVINSDSLRIKQVLNNLISNSFKFTKSGHIKIYISKNKYNKKGNFLFSIQDTGIGMSAEQVQKLFHPFEQTNESITRKFGGSGLGLFISKGIVELLGGEMWVESEKDKGSIFYFTLSLSVSEQSKPETSTSLMPIAPQMEINNHLKILIVDDNDVNRLIGKSFLRKRFAHIYEADNGQSAYDFYIQEHPHIIFMDLCMPHVDGKCAIKMIRNYEEKYSFAPSIVIALTAQVFKEQQDDCLASGFDYYITKPLRKDSLTILLDNIISKFKCDPLL